MASARHSQATRASEGRSAAAPTAAMVSQPTLRRQSATPIGKSASAACALMRMATPTSKPMPAASRREAPCRTHCRAHSQNAATTGRFMNSSVLAAWKSLAGPITLVIAYSVPAQRPARPPKNS